MVIKSWILCLINSNVPVIVSRLELFDFSHGEPDPSYDTVLRILDVLLLC
jgi:hypothetical protein